MRPAAPRQRTCAPRVRHRRRRLRRGRPRLPACARAGGGHPPQRPQRGARDRAAGRAALGGAPRPSGDCVSDAIRRRWRGLPCATGRGGWGPLRARAGDRPTGDPGKVARGAPGKAAALDADHRHAHPEPRGPASRGSRFGRSVAAGPAPRARPPPAARRFAADASGASPAATSPTTSGTGQAMGADRSGPTVEPASGATGEVGKARPFVAAPPYSRRACVGATAGMKQDAVPPCHAHAHELFGGVAVRCVCDNPKTCVAKHPREGEVVPNEAYESLGRHHMCASCPPGPEGPGRSHRRRGRRATSPPPSPGRATRCIQSSKSRQFALSISYTSPRACLRP